ncbi:MAG: trypsin-like peptidase domain-containing protein [Oscillospiraceae bacterium]|jgi:S1-C subfamily serine protease|nr:trypsin-like peptidase domain-containing protein [Oscillospiraceae bacterium]
MTIKRLTAALVAIAVAIAIALPISGSAAIITPEGAAETLAKLGLLNGDADGDFMLDKPLTKQDGVILLCRLLGIADSTQRSQFKDVDAYAQGYVANAYARGLVNGATGDSLGARNSLSERDWLTLLLRALGYSEPGDFDWAHSVKFADSLGLTYDGGDRLTRGDAVTLAFNALITKVNGGDAILVQRLVADGVIARESLRDTSFAGYANYGKPTYDPEVLYRRGSAATFFMEVFNTEERLIAGTPDASASGFFFSADGLALISYHAIERRPYMQIKLTDGRVFKDVQVLWRDGWRDLALIRVGKTDADGAAVSAFPFIPLGDSDLLNVGEPIYALSSPLGLTDSMSSGIVATKLRDSFGANSGYPEIQFSAQVSQGSSGGVLLNRYGEAVGVIRGAYINGNDLNIAVPVKFLPADALTAPGISVKQAADEDEELNLKSTLTADKLSVTIAEGGTAEIVITRDSPGSVSMQFHVLDNVVAVAEWGEFLSITDTSLKITGRMAGKTTVTVSYADGTGNPDAKLEISVTVR